MSASFATDKTEQIRLPDRSTLRFAIAGVIAALVLALGIAAFSVRDPAAGDSGDHAVSMTPRPAPPVQPVAVAPVMAAEITADPIEPPPPADDRAEAETAPVPGRARITTKAPSVLPSPPISTIPPTTVAPPPEAIPSAAAVAESYARVGRALGQLDQTHGLNATLDLWPRYRRIRINAVLADGEQRREVTKILEQLQHDISARAK